MSKPLTQIIHSPAPFTAAGPYSVLDADRNSIASFSGPHKAGNQALFAAAPDLLEACRLALFLAQTKAPWTEEQIAELEAAIAKTQEAGKS